MSVILKDRKEVSDENYIDDIDIDLAQNPIQENGLYYTNMLLFKPWRYQDVDMTKTLHVGILNRAKKIKKEGDKGMVKISLVYQPITGERKICA